MESFKKDDRRMIGAATLMGLLLLEPRSKFLELVISSLLLTTEFDLIENKFSCHMADGYWYNVKLFILFFAFYSLSLKFLHKLPRDAVPWGLRLLSSSTGALETLSLCKRIGLFWKIKIIITNSRQYGPRWNFAHLFRTIGSIIGENFRFLR